MRLPLLALLFAAQPGWGGDLVEANKLYGQSKFAEAAAAYKELAARDPLDPAAHYNLGNAYFRLAGPGDLARAIASYERAFNLSPRDGDVRHNFDFALKRAGETLVPTGMPSAAFILFHILSRTELSALHWLGFWAFLLLAAAALWREKWREALKPWVLWSGLFWAAAGGWWGLLALSDVQNPGVVLTLDAEVRSGPGLNFPVNFKSPEGRRVSILDEKEGWVEIGVLKEGLKGWISAEQVERI
ncbi:MAG: tetratricopeptide repeat protein [Elusimicrobia bacterium]|nr:tetratricopeptide repeat protein [Elusimicrobiota bacterium]